jgi:hypothetical protein
MDDRLFAWGFPRALRAVLRSPVAYLLVLVLLYVSPAARQLYVGAWERVVEYRTASMIESAQRALTRVSAQLLPATPIPVAPGKLRLLRNAMKVR